MRTYTRPGLAEAVLELLDRLALTEAVVVGWSLGGHIGIEMMPRFKGMGGLMIVGAPPAGHGQMSLAFSQMPQAAGKQDLTRPEIEEFVQAIFGASAAPFLRDAVARADGRFRKRLFEAARAGAGVDQRLTVEQSTVPLAVVNGDADRLVNLDYFDSVAYAGLWEGRCHRVAGAGHAPFRDAPERFDPVLERFLQHLKSGRGVPGSRRIEPGTSHFTNQPGRRSRTMNVPSIVNAYFEADKGDDADALARLFSSDAVVEDEGGRHKGNDAIRAWWLAAKRKYRHVAELIEWSGAGNEVSVRSKVSGQFPNSPANLEFSFTVEDGEIVALRIR